MIRAKQPEGPYRIGGYSFGGIVAFEIAARLEAMGNAVKLVMFDMINPAADPIKDRGVLRRIRVAWKRFEPDTPLERCGRILGRVATRRAANRIRQARLQRCAEAWNKGTLTDLEDRAFYLNELHQQLLEDYTPKARVRDALLIKSAADVETSHLPDDYGWGAVIDSLKFLPVPADHFTVFAAPSIEKMVPGLQSYLA
jgi:thioesterase domain-containing protein